MKNNKFKKILPLGVATGALLVSLSAAPAADAAISQYYINDGEQTYEYSLTNLVDSFNDDMVLYNDFDAKATANGLSAFYDDVSKKYVPFNDVLDAFNDNKDITEFTEGFDGEEITMPEAVTEVKAEDGKIVTEEKPIDSDQDDFEIIKITETIDDFSVAFGTDFDELELPSKIEVTLNNSEKKMVVVEWDEADYNADEADTYTLTGTLVLEDGIINPENLTVSVNVTVEEAAAELEVESVSAIETTFVEVEFEALEEAVEDYTVEVIDGEGNVVEVVAQDLAAGTTSAQFDFVTPVAAADLDGVWTVNGVEYSFTELALVEDIVAEAGETTVNEVKLLALLNEAGIQNINEAYLGDYATEIDNEAPVWFADVQKNIDDVNEDKADDTAEAAVVKAVADAESQVQLLAALQANFERVNPDWIVGYAQEDITAVTGTNMLDLDEDNYFGVAATGITAADIQAAIDAENDDAIVAADGAADTAAKQVEVTALIQNWVEADDPETPLVTPKADDIEASQIKEAAYRVAEATTENSLYNALVAYANATEDSVLEASELNANLKTYYLDALETGTVVSDTKADIKGNTIAEIVGGTNEITIKTDIVTAADTASLAAALDAVGTTGTALDADQTDATKTAEFKTALQQLADFTSHYTADDEKFLMSTIDAELTVEYATALKGIDNTGDVDAVQTAVEGVNDGKALLEAANVIADSTSTVTEVRDALVVLALDNSNTTTDAYVEASSAVKLEVAQFIIDNNDLLADPITVDSIDTDSTGSLTAGDDAYNTNALEQAMLDHAAKVQEFNNIGTLATIAGTKTALDAYAYDAYVALSAAEKLAVAEEINSLVHVDPTDGSETPYDFTGADAVETLAEANAIIDAAIAAVAN